MARDILPGNIGQFASALSDATETPPELATLMTLGAVSCALGGKVLVEAEPGYREPCRLYVCCALESGNRKTAVVNAVTGPLSTWERKQRELMAPAIQQAISERKTLEAVIEKARSKMSGDLDFSEEMVETQQRIAELEASLPVIPVAPLLWTSDSTQEKIECLLAEHGQRFAWISDEGGIFDILAGRYSKGLNLDVFLDCR